MCTLPMDGENEEAGHAIRCEAERVTGMPKTEEARFDGVHCSLVIQRPLPAVVVLRIAGTDIGEFGEAPMRALDEPLAGAGPIELFVDARDVRGASIDVSAMWAQWLSAHRLQLREVSMLTGSRFVQVTADFVRRFAELEGIMNVYTEGAAFDAALAEAVATGRLGTNRATDF
jgi:hypothetical protein